MAESAHFGAEFVPSLVWLVSLPVLTIYLLGMTVYKVDSYLERRYLREGFMASIWLWPLTLLIYVALGIHVLV